MTPRAGRLGMVAVARLGFAVGVRLTAGRELFPRSEAISIFGGAEKPGGGSAATPAPSVNLPDFSGLAEHVAPSVVNISSTQEVKGGPFAPGEPGGPGGGGEGDPFHDFFGPFERFFGPPRHTAYQSKRLGSG